MSVAKARSGIHEFELSTDPAEHPGFSAGLSVEPGGPGVEFVRIRIGSASAAMPPKVRLEWTHPAVDIHSHWDTGSGYGWHVFPDWWMNWKPLSAKGSSGAPVVALFNASGRNRLTFAVSEAVEPVRLTFGVNEETSRFRCAVSFFSEAPAPVKEYSALVRIDTSDVPVSEALAAVSGWWAPIPER